MQLQCRSGRADVSARKKSLGEVLCGSQILHYLSGELETKISLVTCLVTSRFNLKIQSFR
jgi:hypothetical protein